MPDAFAERVLAWFDVHGRKDLPWQVDDAYAIWISEIMLQQTQVQTVIPYFERFMRASRTSSRWPTRRWTTCCTTGPASATTPAPAICTRPPRRSSATSTAAGSRRRSTTSQALPGIGRSTAGAILALAFDQRHPILDGNVKRVLARHEAIDGWPGEDRGREALWALAEEQHADERVADYTQAIMDLGATLCTRSQPRCASARCTPIARPMRWNGRPVPGQETEEVKPLQSRRRW